MPELGEVGEFLRIAGRGRKPAREDSRQRDQGERSLE